MLKIFIAFFFTVIAVQTASAQNNFAEKCLGIWTGTMQIYGDGALKSTVKVKLTVAKTSKPNDYTWKAEYFSPTTPRTKDYILRVQDIEKGIYITDEGGGVELVNYLFENKLYNVFEVQGIILTATYELKSKKELIFEVTSGKFLNEAKSVKNFSVSSLQRVVFKKSK